MKISNNALNFLLAQYRAIFKRAYVKGLAAAVMLTAGLAAGQAQAANSALTDPSDLPSSGENFTFDGVGGNGNNQYTYLQISSGSTTSLNGTINITSGGIAGGDSSNHFNGSLAGANNATTISGKGTININIANAEKAKEQGLAVFGAANEVTVDVGTININQGTLKVFFGTSDQSGSTLIADQINVGTTSATSQNAYLTIAAIEDSSITAKVGDEDTIINVNKGGMVNLQSSGSGKAVLTGANLVLNEGALMLTDSGTSNTVEVKNFTQDANTFKVISGSSVSETFAGTTGTVANGANVLVGAGASWILSNTKDEVVDGEVVTPANVTFESGSNVQIGGTLNISGGKLTVADGAGLHAITAAGTGTSGSIIVSNSGTTTGTLSISAADLKAFLNGTNKHQTISESNGQYSLDDGEPVADKSGSLILSSGNLFLTGTSASTPFDLATELKFSGASAATTGAAGIIVVNKNSISTVYGDNLAVSKQLGDGSNNLTGASSNLFIEANTLTLGAANTASPSDLGFSGATTHNLTVLSNDDGGFKLVNDITLHATDRDVTRDVTLGDDYIETAEDGTIKGNLNVSGATLTVNAGRYKTEDDLTISSGSLAISGTSGDADGSYYPNALDASLTVINGDFEITNNTNDTNSSVTITGASGATAFLDLRQAASVTWGSGTVTVSGATAQRTADGEELGQGILYLNGTQFGNFLADSAKTKLDLQGDGVLYVDGTTTSLSSSIDVTDFGTAAAAGKVAFTGAGTFETNVGLTLNVAADASTDAAKVLAIGAGTIKAPSITLKNNLKDAKDFTISGGTLEIASNLDSNKSMVIFKDNTGSGSILKLAGNGSVDVNTTFNGANSKLQADEGTWTFGTNDVYLTSGAGFSVGVDAYQVANLTLDNLNIANTTASTAETSGSVAAGSELTVTTMQAMANTTIDVYGDMTIEGKSIASGAASTEIPEVQTNAATAGVNLSGADFTVSGAEAQLTIGAAATAALVEFKDSTSIVNGSSVTVKNLEVKDALNGAEFTLDGYATLRLEFADNVTLTAQNAAQLKDQLFDGADVGKGIINVGDAKLAIKWEDEAKKIAKWENVKDFAEIESVTSDQLQQALITDITGSVAGHYGAMLVNADTTLMVNGRLGLHAARGGYFVFSEDSAGQKTAEDVSVTGGSLLLAGAGKIGAINAGGNDVTIAKSDLEGAVAGTTEVQGAITNAGILSVSNDTTVAGNVSANELYLSADTALTNDTYSMTLGELELEAGAYLGTTNLTLNSTTNDSFIAGTVEVSEDFTVEHGNVGIANGTLTAKHTALASGVTLQVGYDGVEDEPNTDFDESASYSGRFETQSLALNGGTLIVDPEYGDATALASIRNFADATDADYTDRTQVGTADGSIFVGQNSALGIGTENLAELEQLIARYQVDGSLRDGADNLGAIVYLGGITEVAAGQGMVMTNMSVDEFIEYYNRENGATTAGDISESNLIKDNQIFFGEGTALMADADAIKAAAKQGTALVTLGAGATKTDGTLVADGGEVLITGDLRGNTIYTLFADTGTDSKVRVEDITGETSGASIAVSTENGFLVGDINNTNGGMVTLTLAKGNRAIMSGASDPVYHTLVAYFQGYNSVTTDEETGAQVTDDLYNGYVQNGTDPATGEPIMVKNTDYSNYFLAESVAHGNGAAAETAARLGIYGGAPQAAIQAGKSSTDAIASRFGIGSALSNLTVAGNTQGAALWLAPVYKSADSDGFEAQGLDYGVNVDLYGVALGADYTLANGITFGAMFNVGSGEVDGEGAASATSNDFDYYGFGLYASYTMGQFSVVGDVSYTSVDNDLEGNTSVDRIGASLDSTNLSIGVTGKYALSFNGVDITPHAGLRFSNIDLDDYTIDGRDTVASADSDDMSIFSIPVGVTVAKEFKGETWTVAPSFDLTLTGQFGDDELDGDVSWAGVSNLSTHTTTEVFDNFTYGATLGVEAQSVGGVALGLSVGYTGSSNTDELGVNANARFVF